MTLLREIGSTYARIGITYWRRGPSLLLLALIVFVPLGLLDALALEIDVDSLDLTNGLRLFAFIAAVGAVTVTSLLGEVFYSGAVAYSLTHPENNEAPPIREIARQLNYVRLIAVDIIYVVAVLVGMVLVFVPGVLVFVWFGLSGPVVELEDRTIRGSLRRSASLVRHHFWLVFWILAPVELIGDAGGDAVAGLVHDLLGHSLFASWAAESVANIFLTPVFAIAAVLLTLDLIERKDGAAAVPGSVSAATPAATPV